MTRRKYISLTTVILLLTIGATTSIAQTIQGDIYGGGALSTVEGSTNVILYAGNVGSVYGGGLGQLESGTIGNNDYKPAIASDISHNTTVTLDGAKVNGSIFGCNNVNGTPRGHAKVHVLSTTKRDGQAINDYDVVAVYGGGNEAAYNPDLIENAEEYAEVLIENCNSKIGNVYGGGNAAPVPATRLSIYGGKINNTFGGGNGAGISNPGADVGYLGYYSNGSRTEYGTGNAETYIYGGTIQNVYGGSNTLGYIRTSAAVNIDEIPGSYAGEHCDLNVVNVHGGGNRAPMYCNGSVSLNCSKGVETIYAGSNEADINGNIVMNITSGTYANVYGGNNTSGNINGSIKINIDETGCFPIIIGNLYGCGNMAPYSIYGYNMDKSCKTSGERLYEDPEVNIISCTSINNIFGGGNGSGATLYGNTNININTIKGKYAGTLTQVPYILDNDGNWTENTINGSNMDVPDDFARIGNVYGGGNAAAISGNTIVKIGNLERRAHVSGSDTTTEQTVGVNILGNVFGGSKGVSDNPNAGRVTGTTKVLIGDQ